MNLTGHQRENIQKQPSRSVLGKSFSENMQQIYRRTPILKCDFNRVALQLYWNHTWHECSPENLLHVFRTPFPKSASGGLLLKNHCNDLFGKSEDTFWRYCIDFRLIVIAKINTIHSIFKWKSKTRVTSCELRVQIYELRVQIYELRVQLHDLRVQSWNPRVTSSTARVTSSNPWVTSLNPRVTNSDPRVTSSNPQVRGLKARVRRLRVRVEAIKPRVK